MLLKNIKYLMSILFSILTISFLAHKGFEFGQWLKVLKQASYFT